MLLVQYSFYRPSLPLLHHTIVLSTPLIANILYSCPVHTGTHASSIQYSTTLQAINMNWMRNKLKSSIGHGPLPVNPTDTSSITASAYTIQNQQSDITIESAARQNNLQPQLPHIHNSCYVCATPCNHSKYPSTLVSKIDTDSMVDSVKSYQRHIVICIGQSYEKWAEKIDKSNPYVSSISQYIKQLNLSYDVRVTVTDQSTDINDTAYSVTDMNSKADIMLYPEMIKFHACSIDDIKYIIDECIVSEKSHTYIKNKFSNTDNNTNIQPYVQLRDGIQYTPIDTTDVLVCAHKLRDKRCGIMGGTLIKSLHDTATQHNVSDKIRVLSTSHVGGHKYAANVIIYPHGEWLGRITPCQSDSIIQAYIMNDSTQYELLQPWLRGKIDLNW